MAKNDLNTLLTILFLLIYCYSLPAEAESNSASKESSQDLDPSPIIYERYNTGWAIQVDNDALVSGGNIDRDYTGGIAITLSGSRVIDYSLSFDHWRQQLDHFTGLDNFYRNKPRFYLHSLEFGLTLFTPSNIDTRQPLFDDHPYANLFFISSATQIVTPDDNISFQSSLTLGVLGLRLGEELQSISHKLLDIEEPQGWDNQISAGGELTAKYSFSAQKNMNRQQTKHYAKQEFKLSSEMNIGFSTDVSVGFNWRWGRITTPWWSYNPHMSDYINMGIPVVAETESTHKPEFFLWLGASYKYRFYNAILQGQFRDSAVTYDNDQLENTILESWIGVTREFNNGIRISLFVRKRSEELDFADARKPEWGGIVLSKTF